MKQKMFSFKIFIQFLVIIGIFITCLTSCSKKTSIDYSNKENRVYCESDLEEKTADVFFLCPTVYFGDEESHNMSLTNAKTKERFVGAINMEKGIYDTDCRFYAPYYRQAALAVYEMEPESNQEEYFLIAYQDVKASFDYYLKNYNQGRPIILAGFSQGADMCIRLIKDLFQTDSTYNLLIACYAIGWRLTEPDVLEYTNLRPATGEFDTGVIVTFNSEAVSINSSLLVPEGIKTYAINPLNWCTDGTVASKELNKGACFTNYDGTIKKEIPNLTGAYLDSVRGTLKVTDVTPIDYPPVLSIFSVGVYHLYDYQFFYRNLKENVTARINSYKAK